MFRTLYSCHIHVEAQDHKRKIVMKEITIRSLPA